MLDELTELKEIGLQSVMWFLSEGNNAVNILQNIHSKKYIVMDDKGILSPSEYFYNINQCKQYINNNYKDVKAF